MAASPFACCFSNATLLYGGACSGPPPPGHPPVSTFSDLASCWKRARSHFANNTIVGAYNLTAAEKYSIFIINLGGSSIDGQNSAPLKFEADIFADGATPELGYLPFELQIALPSPKGRGHTCPRFALKNLAIDFSIGTPPPPGHAHPGFTFTIAGCGRDAQAISGLDFHAIGFGTLQVSFATLRDSPSLLSIEPSEGTAPIAADAFSFVESHIENSTISYFGDVTGDLGQSYGATQNGSTAVGSVFQVADPKSHGSTSYRYRKSTDGYRFSWLGSMPQEWSNTSTSSSFAHLRHCKVQYIRDVMLGSVNVMDTSFDAWVDGANPVFDGLGSRHDANPPSFTAYNMEAFTSASSSSSSSSSSPSSAVRNSSNSRFLFDLRTAVDERRLFGANLTNVDVTFLWDVAILRSACHSCTIKWALDLPRIPHQWASLPSTANPSFWVALETADPKAGFPQVVHASLACMRPATTLRNGSAVPPQRLTTDNESDISGSTFAWATASAASHRPRDADLPWRRLRRHGGGAGLRKVRVLQGRGVGRTAFVIRVIEFTY